MDSGQLLRQQSPIKLPKLVTALQRQRLKLSSRTTKARWSLQAFHTFTTQQSFQQIQNCAHFLRFVASN